MALCRAISSRLTQLTATGVATACIALVMVTPARAQGHRARLSADLADSLADQSQAIDLIVHGTRDEVDALAAKYNVVVRKYLKSGAVLTVNAGQLDAIAQDDAVDHLSGDTIIRSKAEVTAETIGADQLWAGDGNLKPLSGTGVSVAVIDTGIDTRHEALKNRVIFTKDFTGGDGMDRFGHGTHVAGIIAGGGGSTPDTSG
jgi:subtilisin family serine protease